MLVSILNSSPSLSVHGRKRMHSLLLHSLEVRLRSEQFFADNKEEMSALDIKHRLMLVTGLPRSGTTVVHNLLGVQNRNLVSFDYADYYDPSQIKEHKADGVKQSIESLKRSMPILSRKHNLKDSKKEDDYFLMRHSFLNPVLALSIRHCEVRAVFREKFRGKLF